MVLPIILRPYHLKKSEKKILCLKHGKMKLLYLAKENYYLKTFNFLNSYLKCFRHNFILIYIFPRLFLRIFHDQYSWIIQKKNS